MIIVFCSVIGYVFPEVSQSPIINLLLKGSIVATLYIAAVFQLKLAPEIFNGIKERFFKK
jgi:hypothetical protein